MNRRSRRMICLLTVIPLLAALTISCSLQQPGENNPSTPAALSRTLNPKAAPGGNFDLSKWELQLPSGSRFTTIPSSRLQGADGYQDLYFYTDQSDGAMTFMDPETGVTSPGSKHPRTELREVTRGWPASGSNILSIREKVTRLSHTTAIGQIFQAPPAPSKPLLELLYESDGTIKALLENTNQGGSSTLHTVGKVPVGTLFSYSLSLTGTTITVTINDKPTRLTMPSSFEGERFYFKAGNYDQGAKSGPPGTTPGSLVKIYSLDLTHN